MRNFFLILLFVFNVAFCDTLEFIDESSIKIEYAKAKKYFDDDQYEKSYEVLKKLFLKDFENEEISYALAKTAIKLKKYGIAEAAFERILIANPKNYKIKFEKAKLLYLTGNVNRAIYSLNNLLKEQIDLLTRKNINKYLDFIKRNKKLFNIDATFLFSLNYSDNVNNAPNNKYILPNFDYLGIQGDDKQSDGHHVELINLDFMNRFNTASSLILKNNFTYLKKSFFKQKDENFEYYSYKPSVFFKNKEYVLYLGSSFSRFKPGHNLSEDYFDALGFELGYYKKKYAIDLKEERFFYRNEDKKDKNYTRYQSRFRTFNKEGINLTTTFAKDISFKSQRTDINKISLESILSYTFKINNSLSFEPAFRYKLINYEHESIAFNSRRKDRLKELSLLMSKKIDDSSNINLNIGYLDNGSNHEEYDYKDKAIGFTYIKTFSF